MFRDFLSEIIEQKKNELKEKNTFLSYWQLRQQAENPHLNRFFEENISQEGRLNLIAEIKKASPSRGIIRDDFDPVKIAKIYQDAGADALSIITEEHFFEGKLSFINDIRLKTRIPILRKDFIVDDYQIYESYVHGADAILLIAEVLEKKQLTDFISLCHKLGLDCLVEIHNANNLSKALDAGAQIIGINNRDLHSFQVDLKTTAKLRPLIPSDKIVVSESGIRTPEDIALLKELGVNAALIGEAFLEAEDISGKVKSLMQ